MRILLRKKLLESIKDVFEGKNLQTQYAKLAIEVYELGHNDRNIDYLIQRQRAIEKEFGCVFLRINTDKQNFKFLKVKNEKHRQAY